MSAVSPERAHQPEPTPEPRDPGTVKQRVASLTPLELGVIKAHVEYGCSWKQTVRLCGLRSRDELAAVCGSIKRKLGASPFDMRRKKEQCVAQ